MMLTSTSHAEIGRLDREIAGLTRARFAALARCDQITAGKLRREIQKIKQQRDELTAERPLFPRSDE
jgi:hypothetical protein